MPIRIQCRDCSNLLDVSEVMGHLASYHRCGVWSRSRLLTTSRRAMRFQSQDLQSLEAWGREPLVSKPKQTPRRVLRPVWGLLVARTAVAVFRLELASLDL